MAGSLVPCQTTPLERAESEEMEERDEAEEGEESEEEWTWASAAVQGRTLLLLLLVHSTSELHQIGTSVGVSQ